jgi:hypothetical protein
LNQQLLQNTLSNIADLRHQMLKEAAKKLAPEAAGDDAAQRLALLGTWRSGKFSYIFSPDGGSQVFYN